MKVPHVVVGESLDGTQSGTQHGYSKWTWLVCTYVCTYVAPALHVPVSLQPYTV